MTNPPPTPASLLEEAEKIHDADDGHTSRCLQALAMNCGLTQRIAKALHSIQAQTIREMVRRTETTDAEVPRDIATWNGDDAYNVGVDNMHFACVNALRSYAKEKNVSL